jgi:hypothetical protein
MKRGIGFLLGSVLILSQLAGCQKAAPFNPALGGRFFPLRSGLTWTYQVVYLDGGRETITDQVIKRDHVPASREAVLVVSHYSGNGTRAVRTDLPQAYPAEMNEVETHYLVNGGYISRVASLGGASRILLEERNFLPQYLSPDRGWSNSLSPFAHLQDQILDISQDHRSFLEPDLVVVPAGRFSECIRVETKASYRSLAESGDKRYFTDWYAPDVGLVKTLVSSSGSDGPEIARIELLRFTKSETTAPVHSQNGPSTVFLSSKISNSAASAHPITHR